MPTRILLAESDDVLRASLAEQLEREGYDVVDRRRRPRRAAGALREAVRLRHHRPGRWRRRWRRRCASAGFPAPILLLTDGEAASRA